VERQLDLIHMCGVANIGVKKEDIIVDTTGVPWFTDFERARTFRSTSSVAFAFMRDQDRVKFNQLYGRNLMTERSARVALAAQVAKVQEEQGWYSPIDFGNGFIVGPIWITSHGPGRWEFLNKHVVAPLVTGKRVLDLGSNNGVLPMMMLRAGAREVIGVELSLFHAEAIELVRRIYEWRDMRRYRLTVYNCDMLEILRRDWGKFDVVTAFCSLYYLQADDMARVVYKVSELAPVMVLQANTLSKPTDRREKASLVFLKKLLEDNGFPKVEVFAPPDYNRPLLVGRIEE
jgi:2-polyprenyl-3-methyl-5-hydroxy-6-metoxy-1,4-benzoquinol methylase